jgi:GntR family mannosyl-D-glycerate transport/metabolism transcriptional repressor
MPRELHKYRQIAAALRERITSGDLQPGDPVPSAKTLAQEFDTSLETARKALRLLLSEDLIEFAAGLNFYVK